MTISHTLVLRMLPFLAILGVPLLAYAAPFPFTLPFSGIGSTGAGNGSFVETHTSATAHSGGASSDSVSSFTRSSTFVESSSGSTAVDVNVTTVRDGVGTSTKRYHAVVPAGQSVSVHLATSTGSTSVEAIIHVGTTTPPVLPNASSTIATTVLLAPPHTPSAALQYLQGIQGFMTGVFSSFASFFGSF